MIAGLTGWLDPSLRHIAALTTDDGIVEHAAGGAPRPEFGCCTDDAGRALALAARMAGDPSAYRIASVAVAFLARAYHSPGRFRLRWVPGGTWTHDPPSDDGCGRALLGLGTAAVHAPWADVRDRAAELFSAAAGFRSPHPRAMAYALLGAAEVLTRDPADEQARRLVDDGLEAIPPSRAGDAAWPWPFIRLTYANALLPEARLAAATILDQPDAAKDALALLGWLVGEETGGRGFSFTPVGGRARHDPRPGFGQQPIEAWAMADACRRAYAYTGDEQWRGFVTRAGAWFMGDNDLGVPMHDPETGGGFDGLERLGPNRNQGAESGLAFVGTMLAVRAAGPLAYAAQASSSASSSAASR